MRHRVKTKKFNRHAESRNALFRSLAIALFQNGKIETTLPKAKYMRPVVEKLITRAKEASLHSRRLLISHLNDKTIVEKLITEIAPLFKDRNGGYTRINRTRVREGDVTQMATISFVEDAKIEEKKELKAKKISEKEVPEAKKPVKKEIKKKAVKKVESSEK